jgi:glycosyltransferase involved in cell wall biosynthesis
MIGSTIAAHFPGPKLDMAKIDLLMWTYNSQATLEESLSSIEGALPEDRVCHRIIVDGGSSDATEKIARRHCWDFYVTHPSIPVQANFGLRMVDTDFYASFEHDIVLSPSWMPRIERLMNLRDVAVAQGIRLSKGVPSLEALDRWSYFRGRYSYSMDNNMYRTESIRKLGGYPLDCPMTTDGFLRRKVLAQGMRWIIDPGCISWHLRAGFPEYLRHVIQHLQNANFLWEPEGSRLSTIRLLKIFLTSPYTGQKIASKMHTPSIIVDYPLLRFVLLVAMSIVAREKEIIVAPRLRDESLRV